MGEIGDGGDPTPLAAPPEVEGGAVICKSATRGCAGAGAVATFRPGRKPVVAPRKTPVWCDITEGA